MRQEGERLLVVEFQTVHSHIFRVIVIRGDVVVRIGVGIEGVGREKFVGGLRHGGDESVLVIADEATDGDLAAAHEVVFETGDVALGLPRFQVHVAEGDTVARAGRVLGVGEGHAADVVGKLRAADGLVVGAARDQVFGKIVAKIEAGEEAEKFLFRGVTPVDERALERAERIGGAVDDLKGDAVRIFDDVASGIASEI